MTKSISIDIDGKIITIETGKMAKQAGGASVIRMGDTIVISTACSSEKPIEGKDFFPLTVEYRERLYAGGKIPGGFFKREGKQTEKETLSSRLIDRPLRPLFPKGYNYEVQIIASVISADPQIDSDVHAITASSVALGLSNIPFKEPVAGIRIGRKNGAFIAFPTIDDLLESDLDMVVAGTESSILMVEGGSYEISEQIMIEAIEFAHERIKKIVIQEKDFIKENGKQNIHFEEKDLTKSDTYPKIEQKAKSFVLESFKINGKLERSDFLKKHFGEIKESLLSGISDKDEKQKKEQEINSCIEHVHGNIMREYILNNGKRIGERALDEIRPITCEVGILPRTHGSALFTRGETQALVTTTLGTKLDEQRIENYQGESFKNFMLHYNFLPFCTGEVKMIRGTGRREIGHGNLAERALAPILPVCENFPYTIRVVSDILESNGSSSMATVCGGSLCLMDAGVPIKAPVAGIAMGLIKSSDRIAILSDILGDEDHLGDMDFKVAGTVNGITSFQMDIKIDGITSDIMRNALEQARKGRLHILDIMQKTIAAPKSDISQYAPRIMTLKIPVDKIGLLIGPGGKTIRGIQEDTGAIITVEDDGTVMISSVNTKDGDMAKAIVEELTQEEEIGKVYKGKVKNITNFGAFVEFMPGKEGLLHISEIEHHRVNKVEDVLKSGDEVMVKLIGVDNQGKCRLSRKAILPKE